MGTPGKKQNAVTGFAMLAAALALFTLDTGIARAPDAPLACEMPLAEAAPERPVLDAGQQALVRSISRRYQVAPEALGEIVAAAYRAAAGNGLDPLLVLAVISIESRFNPFAESSMGAKGLMQIIPKVHLAKLAEHGGEHSVLDPESNILIGARILREYIHRTGTLEAGLQFYNGASRDETGLYSQKVLAERQRLEQTLRTARRTVVLASGS